jgi:anti-sigma-K factor RskA
MRDDEIIGVEERDLDDLALEALAEAHRATPPARLRGRIVDTIRAETEGPRVRRSLVVWRVVGSIAATLALVMTGLYARERQRGDAQAIALADAARTREALATRLDEQGKTLVGLREAVEAQAQMLRVLSGPRTLTASLAPKEGFAGSGRVLVDAETGEAHVVLAGLPSPGAGKVYELWAIRGDRPPEAAGLLALDAGPATAKRVDRIATPTEVAAFAISLEPEGGSTTATGPRGPIVLVGKVT